MAVTNYYTVNGEIIGEKTTGGSRVDYLTDALGSVIATANQSAQVVNTYRFKPYGAQLAKTGVGADPAFRWVGNHGYRQTGKKWSDVYVRARHYDTLAGRWSSVDSLWPREQQYLYAGARPSVKVDPSGLAVPCCCCAIGLNIINVNVIPPMRHPRSKEFPNFRGCYFEVDYTLRYKPAPADLGCDMYWYETLDASPRVDELWPYGQWVPPSWGKEIELFHTVPVPSIPKTAWQNRRSKCPGETPKPIFPKLWDTPGLASEDWKQFGMKYPSFSYWTYIRILVKSDPECPSCSGAPLEVRFKQYVKMINGVRASWYCAIV